MRILLAVTMVVLGACSGAAPAGGTATAPKLPEGFAIAPLVEGLDGPTQMIAGPDGRLWVAQLNGGENDRDGQVVAIDPDSGDRELLAHGLDKPTGIAWAGDALWIATREAVLRAPGDPPDTPTAVIDDLPNNGRSQGTRTVAPDGMLLYETSGRETSDGVVPGSGILWELDPHRDADRDLTRPGARRMVATGFKNAYAHVHDRSGALWTTEIAEPTGGVAAPDELNRVERNGDHGWPACVGEGRPVARFDGDARRCAGTVAPVVTFDAGATATSVVVDPFAEGGLLVALWNAGQVVRVAADGAVEPFVTGLPHPQHLLVDGGTLLLSDHERGVIYRITRR